MSTSSLMQDQAYVPANAAEELAGPPHRTVPVQRRNGSINSIDALRGFALLGILLMNILGFAYPGISPVQMVHLIFSGPHRHLNTSIYVGRWMLAEGRMRGVCFRCCLARVRYC